MINIFSLLPVATVWTFTCAPTPGSQGVNCTATICHSQFADQGQREELHLMTMNSQSPSSFFL